MVYFLVFVGQGVQCLDGIFVREFVLAYPPPSICIKFLVKKKLNIDPLGVPSKQTNSIFKDIVQIGGREVNPISKKLKEMNF